MTALLKITLHNTGNLGKTIHPTNLPPAIYCDLGLNQDILAVSSEFSLKLGHIHISIRIANSNIQFSQIYFRVYLEASSQSVIVAAFKYFSEYCFESRTLSGELLALFKTSAGMLSLNCWAYYFGMRKGSIIHRAFHISLEFVNYYKTFPGKFGESNEHVCGGGA